MLQTSLENHGVPLHRRRRTILTTIGPKSYGRTYEFSLTTAATVVPESGSR